VCHRSTWGDNENKPTVSIAHEVNVTVFPGGQDRTDQGSFELSITFNRARGTPTENRELTRYRRISAITQPATNTPPTNMAKQ
jgi:hypothetical protein